MHTTSSFKIQYYVLAIAIFLPGTPVFAQDSTQVGIYLDQDLLLPVVNEDRDYTMGFAAEVVLNNEESHPWMTLLDSQVQSIGEALGVHQETDRIRRSYMFGSINYTPQDLSAKNPITDDRPYSSVLFLANKRLYADHEKAIGIEGQIGLLGTYVAREVQTAFHRAWRGITDDDEPVDPEGWSNQISAGGELTARFRFAYAERIDALSRSGILDFAWSSDASIGYQTNASIGLSARIGILRSPFWSIPYDPISRGSFLPSYHDGELYLWGAARSRLVGYDALLQGQFRDSRLTYGSSDIERLVHDAGIGVTASYLGTQITLSANRKTAELKRGKANRTHWWGGIYITYQF